MYSAKLAVNIPRSCGHRLASQVSLTKHDPFLPTADQGAAEEEDKNTAGALARTDYDCKAQCEQLQPPPVPEEDVLECDVGTWSSLVPSLQVDLLDMRGPARHVRQRNWRSPGW